ncbi:MAG TPA: hypothetical protein VMH87_08315 [Pseudomonadales bacterium]|nr:hypothetical protein [Pseudomonadales bacterium]
MKKTVLKIRPLLALPFLAVLALLGSTLQSQAQFPQGSYTNNFATGGNTSPFAGSGSVASWIYWYNTPGGNAPVTNDVTTPDPLGGAGAGSLQVYSPFTAAGTQNLFFGTFGNGGGYDFSLEVNLLNFTNVAFDIYVGTNNVPNTDGNFGTISLGIVNSSYGYEGFGNGTVTIPAAASNGWVHLSVPIDHTIANITAVPGICFDFNNYNGYPTQTMTFWIGNLTMAYSGAPPPNPTVSIAKVVPGLTQFADIKPSYNRQDLRTDMSGTANVTWYNHPGASYSWTISAFPGTSNPNFLAGLNLMPELTNCSDPDWTGTNDVWVALQNNADGTVTAGIAYKTNQPVGNSQLFAAPTQLVPYQNEAAGLTAPSAIGTWTLKFNNNTSLTLTAPNGASTNVAIPDYVAALYNGYVAAYLYSSAQNDANVGQSCTFSAYNITGVGTPVHEDLTKGALASPFLETISQNYFYTGNYTNHPPDQIFATKATNAFWLSWTLPDAGFSPVSSPSIQKPVWTTLSGTIFQNGSQREISLSPGQLPGANIGFFALIKRSAYQLQVLLPGETNAPNTVSGKIGTPIPQSDNAETMVTINMCDQNWNIVNSSDIITLSSSDESADLPGDAALANGTLTEGMFFGSQGSFTVTASDVTAPTILPNTSSSVTVGP